MLKRIQGCCFTLLVLLLFCCPLAVSAAGTVEAAAWAKVEDDAQLLDEQQLEQLQTQAQQLADQTGFIVFIKTTTSTGGLEVRRYLADQYELAGGSDNQKAILLGIDMGGREVAVATPQTSEDYFPVKKTNAMVDSVCLLYTSSYPVRVTSPAVPAVTAWKVTRKTARTQRALV